MKDLNTLKKNMKDKIALVLPARDDGTGRSNDLRRFVQSWKDQSEGLSDLFVIIDHDDTEPFEFLKDEPNVTVIVQTEAQTKNTLMQKINVAAIDLANKYRYISYAADDIILRTKWESRFIEALEAERIGLVYGNDMVHNGKLPTHPCVTSNFVRILGYFGGPGDCHHNYFDNFWGDISGEIGCKFYLPDVIMEHTHPITGKSEHNYMTERAIRTIEDDRIRYQKYLIDDYAREFNAVMEAIGDDRRKLVRQKVKVIDCFTFFNEFLILDIRLRELYDVVDKFVIIEASETFTGEPKPYYLSECLDERYAKYKDKIEIIKVGNIEDVAETNDNGYSWVAPGTEKFWNRSDFQRSHISKESLAHLNLSDNDIILIGDADEIPRNATVLWLKENPGIRGALEYRYYHFKLNQQHERVWIHARFTTYGKFVDIPTERYGVYDEGLAVRDAGWHFSYLATPEDVQRKINAIEHQELNYEEFKDIEFMKQRVESGKDMVDREDHPMRIVPIDSSYPRYIRENIENLREWIK